MPCGCEDDAGSTGSAAGDDSVGRASRVEREGREFVSLHRHQVDSVRTLFQPIDHHIREVSEQAVDVGFAEQGSHGFVNITVVFG
jgi:hypothetical protein